jgi:2-haloacid dehalogenase
MPRLFDRAIDVVVFDAYGTLFDVHSAVARHAEAVGPQATRLSEIWRAKQLEYSWILSLSGQYQPFWTLTQRALDFAFDRVPEADRALRTALLDAYLTLSAFPEVPEVLARLRQAGLKTAILSNGDPMMLDAAVQSAGLFPLLDATLSVDAAGIFKTSPRAYDLVSEEFGAARENVLFVSSNRWDIAGATAYGFASVWCNRTGQPDEYPEHLPCLGSSVLPWFLVTDDGVEDDEDFAHDGGQRDFSGSVVLGDEALVERPQHRVVADG